MSNPFDVYKATYHDQSITGRDGSVLRKRDHAEPENDQEILTTSAAVPEELIEPRATPQMIKGH